MESLPSPSHLIPIFLFLFLSLKTSLNLQYPLADMVMDSVSSFLCEPHTSKPSGTAPLERETRERLLFWERASRNLHMMSWAFLLLQLPMKSREHIGNWLSNSTQMSTKRLVSILLHNPFLYFSKNWTSSWCKWRQIDNSFLGYWRICGWINTHLFVSLNSVWVLVCLARNGLFFCGILEN